MSGVPLKDEAILELLSSLKRLYGPGGALKQGVIEIQGDYSETVGDQLKKRGFTVFQIGG